MSEHEPAVARYPLAWPTGWVKTAPGSRRRASFSTKKSIDGRLSVIEATRRLEGELERLGARNPVLSTNVNLRLDGRPRSDEEPRDPGAAIYFSFRGKATVLACDRWDRVADNIAAIAAHIDALRRIERYGVGTIEQALAGYKALPFDTAADWRAVFGFRADQRVTVGELDKAFKEQARFHHPDRGGSEDKMSQVNRAREFAMAEIAG